MMVRNYTRKTDHGKWSWEQMNQAVAAVLSGTLSIRKAARVFHVPKATLARHYKKPCYAALVSSHIFM